jgi:hypothetical protein
LTGTLTKYSVPKPVQQPLKPSLTHVSTETETVEALRLEQAIQTEEVVNHLEEAKSLLKLMDNSKDMYI